MDGLLHYWLDRLVDGMDGRIVLSYAKFLIFSDAKRSVSCI